MNINVSYGGTGLQYEVIISEPGGTVLLDTITVGAQTLIASLKTNDTLVDVTTVMAASPGYYDITSYKSINASTIRALEPYSYVIGYSVQPQATTPVSILYDNIPPGVLTNVASPQFAFTNFPNNEFTGSTTIYDNNSISIYYNNYAGNYAYFLLPSVGLYSLHMQVNAADTVDCSNLDTANFLTFNRPQPFTVNSQYSSFIGIPDTTDLTKLIGFTDFLSEAPARPGVDFEYPKIPVQKYELQVNAANASNDGIGYYSYGDTIPLTLPFFQESDVAISSTANNNFSVSFPGAKPTYYVTGWRDSSLIMTVYAPADSSTLNVLALMTNQNSKLLKGFNFTPFKLLQFDMDNVNGMSYGPYMTYITNQTSVNTNRVTFAASLTKTFP